MAGIEVKSLDTPDETRPFADKGQAEVVNMETARFCEGRLSLGGVGLSM
jgi:hypothetical protein